MSASVSRTLYCSKLPTPKYTHAVYMATTNVSPDTCFLPRFKGLGETVATLVHSDSWPLAIAFHKTPAAFLRVDWSRSDDRGRDR